MPRYVDGFLLPVPKKNLPAYRRMSVAAGKIWKKHGALEYCECVGDDLQLKCGVPFERRAKPRRGEAILFSFIVYRSRKDRDRINAKVMQDPAMGKMMMGKAMPFDVARMSMAGFRVLVDL